MKRWLAPLAIGIVVLYAALAIGTSCCLFLHAEQLGQAHHRTPSHAAHSALCALACQTNSTVIVHTVVPLGAVFALVAMLRLVGVTPHTHLFAATSRSRAPPR